MRRFQFAAEYYYFYSFVDTVGKSEKKIAEYIREQLQNDIAEDQISLKEIVDPFTGEKNKKA